MLTPLTLVHRVSVLGGCHFILDRVKTDKIGAGWVTGVTGEFVISVFSVLAQFYTTLLLYLNANNSKLIKNHRKQLFFKLFPWLSLSLIIS